MILLRSLAFYGWFYAVTFAFSLWHGLFTRDERAVLRVAQVWAALVLGGLRRICGIDWVVSGREYLPGGPALVAPLHQSAFDTMVWLLLLPECVYVMKSELTRVPLFGTLLLRSGMISVNRSGGAGAMRDLIRRTAAAAAAGRQILIFPQGTRAAPDSALKLQPGVAAIAARTGLAIIPVATDSGLFWGRRALRKQPGTIRIAILPPLPVGLPREELMARLEQDLTAGYVALGGGKTVDNSVGGASGEFRRQPGALG